MSTGSNESSLGESLSLGEQVKNLEELANYRKQLLDDSEWRYHQLTRQLNLSQEANLGLINALPRAIAETCSPEPVTVNRRTHPILAAGAPALVLVLTFRSDSKLQVVLIN